MQKGIMLKKCLKNKARLICFSFASSFNTAGMSLTDRLSYLLSSSPAGLSLGISISLIILYLLDVLFTLTLHYNIPSVSFPSLSSLRVFLRKTYPAPSARPFGAMRRLELWY